MYAVIETGGKQLKVEVGQEICRKTSPEGRNIYFDKVLMLVARKQLLEHLM